MTTERLVLRPLRGNDVAALVRNCADPRVAATTLIPWPYSPALAQDFIRAQPEQHAGGRGFSLAMCERGDDALRGCVGLAIEPEHGIAQLGYWIEPDRWRRGYATEAARAVVGHAFEVLGLHRVHAGVLSGNGASSRVLDRVGMRREGVLRQHIVRFDRRCDLELFGILRSEWTALRA